MQLILEKSLCIYTQRLWLFPDGFSTCNAPKGRSEHPFPLRAAGH